MPATAYPGGVCATCPFWAAQTAPTADNPNPSGECRESPPRMFMFPVMTPPKAAVMLDQATAQQQATMSMIGQTAFPQTPADGWCGLHPDRQPEEVVEGQ